MGSGARPAGAGPAVVAGASSGIGAAVARGLARRHYDVVLVARSCEVMQRQAAELVTKQVSVLCANAGTAGFGPFTERDNIPALELNVNAVVTLVDALLPGMLARRRGGLLLTGSLAGDQPMPGAARYAAGPVIHRLIRRYV